jgi:hypothetical protein
MPIRNSQYDFDNRPIVGAHQNSPIVVEGNKTIFDLGAGKSLLGDPNLDAHYDSSDERSPPLPEKAPERTTISDDRSAGSNLEVRNLAALKDRAAPRSNQSPLEERLKQSTPAPASHPLRRSNAEYVPIYGTRNESDTRTIQKYKSLLEHGRSQQRFGRLQFGDVLTDDTYVHYKEASKDGPTISGFLEPLLGLQSELVAKDQWTEDVGKTDNSSNVHTAHIQVLQHKISDMQKELQQLEAQKSKHVEQQYRTLYRINGSRYFDHPEWTQGHNSIVSRIPVKNLDLFLERNKNVTFIVYRDFERQSTGKKETMFSSSPPKNIRESIHPVNKMLRKTLESMFAQDWRYESDLNHLRRTGEIKAPYLFLYHHRRCWIDMTTQYPHSIREHLSLFASYISDTYGKEYDAADSSFARREISSDSVKYMFQPGDILISRTAGQYRGLIASSWPQESATAPARGHQRLLHPSHSYGLHIPSNGKASESDDGNSDLDMSDDPVDDYDSDPSILTFRTRSFANEDHEKSVSAGKASKEFSIQVYKWSFDGDFKREADNVTLKLSCSTNNASTNAKLWSMYDLDTYPLKFAPSVLAQQLRQRGLMFWKCRKRCLISYREASPEAHNEVTTPSSPRREVSNCRC